MLGWPVPLLDTLRSTTGEFGISDLSNPDTLKRARQTGFVWTRQPGVICLAMNRRYFAVARDNPDVVAIITPPTVADRESAPDKAVIACEHPDELYYHLHTAQLDSCEVDSMDIDDSAVIDESAILRGSVRIEAGVRVGARVIISGPAVIRRNVTIDVGAIIGCEGLYAKIVDGTKRHIPHFGGVDLKNGAFIHSGAVIVRSAIKGEFTQIGENSHIGVLSNIGHDSEVGEEATISSNCVIAGRARIGAHARVGASVTISNMVNIGESAKVHLGTVVIRDVPAGAEVSGNFATNHTRMMKNYMKEVRNGS